MEKLYLIKFDEKNEPHISIRECEIINTYSSGYEVETGVGFDFVHKEKIDNFNIRLNVRNNNVDGFRAYIWLSNNDRDRILKFENEVLKIINNRIVKLNNEMQRFEKMKMLVGE